MWFEVPAQSSKTAYAWFASSRCGVKIFVFKCGKLLRRDVFPCRTLCTFNVCLTVLKTDLMKREKKQSFDQHQASFTYVLYFPTPYRDVWISYILFIAVWMNELCIYIVLYCVLPYTQSTFTIMSGVSPQPPPVCSIHLDNVTAVTAQQQCAHHTPATGGEERES